MINFIDPVFVDQGIVGAFKSLGQTIRQRRILNIHPVGQENSHSGDGHGNDHHGYLEAHGVMSDVGRLGKPRRKGEYGSKELGEFVSSLEDGETD